MLKLGTAFRSVLANFRPLCHRLESSARREPQVGAAGGGTEKMPL